MKRTGLNVNNIVLNMAMAPSCFLNVKNTNMVCLPPVRLHKGYLLEIIFNACWC